MENPFEKIIQFLEAKGAKYEIFEHEPVYTSEQAAKARGESLGDGAKSLLLKAGDSFLLAVLPGDKRLDNKKLKKILGVKNIRFATSEEVKEIMGCEIGACYPIGDIAGVRTIVDNAFLHNINICFNPGVHDKTIKMKWNDYRLVVNNSGTSDISG